MGEKIFTKNKFNQLIMKSTCSFISFWIFINSSYGYTFKEAINSLQTHDLVESINKKAEALKEEGHNKGSWGDPMIKIAAKNFPIDSLEDDQTPMTGIEFGISQKISLTAKFGNIENAFTQLSKAKKFIAEDTKRQLMKSFWTILINNRKLDEEIKIINENLSWISKILKISKKLYANGKTSQQALLDIQIRKSELEVLASNKKYESKEQIDRLNYLLGFNKTSINKTTIPWQIIEKKKIYSAKMKDHREMNLLSMVQAKENMLSAAKLALVPDLTFSLGYTKRSNIDKKGDFVSAMVTFPLPFSGAKYASRWQATFEKASALKTLNNYKRFKASEVSRINNELKKIGYELKILNEKTIKFAEDSRTVTSKSYGFGNSTYIELLQSELKLQSLLLKRSLLKAKFATQKIAYKYLTGEKLHE